MHTQTDLVIHVANFGEGGDSNVLLLSTDPIKKENERKTPTTYQWGFYLKGNDVQAGIFFKEADGDEWKLHREDKNNLSHRAIQYSTAELTALVVHHDPAIELLHRLDAIRPHIKPQSFFSDAGSTIQIHC